MNAEHVVLFNDNYRQKNAGGFQLFPTLPTELRFEIWRHFLKQNRMISIILESQGASDGDIVDDQKYTARILTQHRVSPLLRTSQEARLLALQFYRLRIPLENQKNKYCLINPEFDYIYIYATSPGFFPWFLHNLKVNDPHRVGLLNIGIGAKTPSALYLPEPRTLEPMIVSSFKTIISNLNTVFFRQVCRGESRMMFNDLNSEEVRFNHSFPLACSAETFEVVHDSRLIEHDLDKVGIGWDPRSILVAWQRMERAFGINCSDKTKFTYHFCAPSMGAERYPCSHKDAVSQVQEEKSLWHSKWETGGIFQGWGYRNPDMERNHIPAAVFGWWVLPLTALKELRDIPQFGEWDMKMVISLKQSRPELIIMQLH